MNMTLTTEEMIALLEYAQTYGMGWKDRLMNAWMYDHPEQVGTLRVIRNKCHHTAFAQIDKACKYFVRGPFCWGFAKDLKTAMCNAKRNYPRGYAIHPKTKKKLERLTDKHLSIYITMNEEIEVDGMYGNAHGKHAFYCLQKSTLAI